MLQLLGNNPDISPPYCRSCPTSNSLWMYRPSLTFARHAQPGCWMPLAYSGEQTAGRTPGHQRPAARPALASQPWPPWIRVRVITLTHYNRWIIFIPSI